jgi:aspartate aminotransferase
MYCVLLLPPAQLEALMQKRRVYLLRDGCLSLGCLDVVKIESLARSLDHVVRESLREAEEQQAQSIAMELALQAATEQQARHEAEEAAAVAAAEAAAAQAEDTMLIEASIQTAMEAQRVADEEERRREEEQRLLEEQVRKAAERAEIARQAELILASI